MQKAYINKIVEFCEKLKSEGFLITEQEIETFLKTISDFSDMEETFYILRGLVCKSQSQYDLFSVLFFDFFGIKKLYGSIETEKENKIKLQKEINRYQNNINKNNEKIKTYQETIKNERKKIDNFTAEHKKIKSSLPKIRLPFNSTTIKKKQTESLVNLRKDIIEKSKKQKLKGGIEISDFLHLFVCGKYKEFIQQENMTVNSISVSQKTLANLMENIDEKYDDVLFEMVEDLEQIKNNILNRENKSNEAIKKINSLQSKIRQSEGQLIHFENLMAVAREKNKNEQEQYENVKSQLDDLNNGIIYTKSESLSHRKEFLQCCNRAVQSDAEQGIMNDNLNTIKDKRLDVVQYYLRKNARMFKTILRRKLESNKHMSIDLKETIKKSIKTNGEPMELCWKKPTKSKTNIVTVLDISGSCSSASTVFLNLVHIIYSVFLNESKNFVFVNKLHNIDSLIKNQTCENMLNLVKNNIPTKGIYSDYGNVIQQLYNNKGIINNETILIFLGDARNNKRYDAIPELKNLCNRAKYTLWLNIDAPNKWSQGDSLSYLYKDIVDEMMYIRTPNDIIKGFEKIIEKI